MNDVVSELKLRLSESEEKNRRDFEEYSNRLEEQMKKVKELESLLAIPPPPSASSPPSGNIVSTPQRAERSRMKILEQRIIELTGQLSLRESQAMSNASANEAKVKELEIKASFLFSFQSRLKNLETVFLFCLRGRLKKWKRKRFL